MRASGFEVQTERLSSSAQTVAAGPHDSAVRIPVADRRAQVISIQRLAGNRAAAGFVQSTSVVRLARCPGCGGTCGDRDALEEDEQRRLGVAVLARAIVARRVVCPPGVTPEQGTGCYEVADDADQSTAPPADQSTAPPPDQTPIGPPPPPDQTPIGPPAPNASYQPPEENMCRPDAPGPGPVALCDRDFAGKLGSIVPARHCFVWYEPGNMTPAQVDPTQTSTYDPSHSGTPDPEPNKQGVTCKATFNVDPGCVQRKYRELCDPAKFDLATHNCCSCAHDALEACGATTQARDFPAKNQGTGLPDTYGTGWKKKFLHGAEEFFENLGRGGAVPLGP